METEEPGVVVADLEPSRLELSRIDKLTSIVRTAVAAPDSKARRPGVYFRAGESNSFGLPAVETCPGSTEFCRSRCYAIESERRDPTALKMRRNYDALREDTVEGMTDKLRALIGDYNDQSDKQGIPQETRQFRIHWDGDFFSVDYAAAWRNVILENPGLKFYVYTRSFQPDVNVLPVLSGIENLGLFISVDQGNVDQAAAVLPDFPDVRVAYFVDYYEDAAELIAKLPGRQNNRARPCPENIIKPNGKRRLPLISELGGACAVCKYCVDEPSDQDVVFLNENKMFKAEKPFSFISEVPVVLKPKPEKPPEVAQPAGHLALIDAQNALF